MLGFVALALLGQMACGEPRGPVVSSPALMSKRLPPPFTIALAAPAAACTGAAATGTKGEASTFTRSTAGFCAKGNTRASIANGDFVSLPANQPRMMPGGDGTGSIGILSEKTAVQYIHQTRDLTAAAWTPEHVTVALPTISLPDAGVAPDGTLTATRITMPATGVGDDSGLRQDVAGLSGSGSACLYVKGFSGSGTTAICAHGSVWACADVAYNASTWTLFPLENVTLSGNPWLFGNVGFRSGNAYGATDVLVWGPGIYDQTTCTSFIDNQTDTNGSRGEDSLSFAGLTIPHRLVDLSASYVAGSTINVGGSPASSAFQLYLGSGDWTQSWYPTGPKQRCNFRFGGTDHNKDSSNNLTASAANALRCFWDGTHWGSSVNATVAQNSTQILPTTGTATLYIGNAQGGNVAVNGVVKDVSLASAQEPQTFWATDSISVQSGAFTYYGLDSSRVIDMHGVSGATFTDQLAQGSPSVCTQQWTTAKKSYDTRIALECGINDIRIYGVDAGVLFPAEKAWVQARAAEGRQVGWFNLLPFEGAIGWDGGVNGSQVQADLFNSSWATYCGSPDTNVTCYNAKADVWDAGDHNLLRADYNSGDNIHPNQDGGAALGGGLNGVWP